jgi:hypothetical protein
MSPEPKGETVWKLPPGKMTSATIPSCSSSARRRFESKAPSMPPPPTASSTWKSAIASSP